MIVSTQITDTEIFAFTYVLFFKLMSRKGIGETLILKNKAFLDGVWLPICSKIQSLQFLI